ncbi:MAG TPA: S1 RNA-binding domain-containing protein [archaeon]|nr:S1 RNA-binding domain-containing protein [archaeon]
MEYPQRDDLVVVRVSQILDYGVFVELLEFGNVRGFVHISNVSSSWVKNIRNFVKPNQVRVAKVLNVDIEKRQIDLSFAGVSSSREKQKINDFKQYNREEKLISLFAKQSGKKFDEVWSAVAEPLNAEYGSLMNALEKVALGEDISGVISKEWIIPLKEMVEKNIVVSEKTLKGKAKINSLASNGVEVVKEILLTIESVKGCSVIYAGSGVYTVTSTSFTFKQADKLLTKAIESAEKKAKELGATFEFKKEENN